MRADRVRRRAALAGLLVVSIGALASSLAGDPPAGADASTDFTVVAGSGQASGSVDATSALDANLDAPSSVAVDSSGNLLVAESGRSEVDVVAVSASNPGYQLAAGDTWSAGDVFRLVGGGSDAVTASGASALSATLSSPGSVSFDSSGNLLIADTDHSEIDVLALSTTNPGYDLSSWSIGDVYLLAGGGSTAPTSTGTAALSSELDRPQDAVADRDGDVLIADTDHKEVEVLATSASNPGYVIGSGASWTVGDLYVVAGGGSTQPTTNGSVALSTAIQQPYGLAVNAAGDVAISDYGSNNVDLLAVNSTAMPAISNLGDTWTVGTLYVLAGASDELSPSDAGTIAWQTSINGPQALTFDSSGNLLVADSLDAEVEVLALSSSGANDVAPADATWTVGDLYVLAGGGSTAPSSTGSSGIASELGEPTGVALTADGAIEVADADANVLEELELAPSTPDAPSATPGTTSVSLSWSAPRFDGGSTISSYLIDELGSSGATLGSITTGSALTSAVVSGLGAATTYGFEIVAENAVGSSTPSAETFVTTGSVTTTTSPASTTPPSDITPATPVTTSTSPSSAVVGVSSVSAVSSETSQAVSKDSPSGTTHPEIRISTPKTVVTSSSVPLELSCSTARCSGRAELTMERKVVEHHGAETETFTETYVLGSAAVRLRAGEHHEVAVRLSGAARRLLATFGVRGARATLTVRLQGGSALVRLMRIEMGASRPAR